MKCKICGSEDVVKENEHYVCKSCGSVFYEIPDDDSTEVIKDAKDAIDAKEAADAAKKAEEEKAAAEAEKILKEREAAAAEKALKKAEEESQDVIEIPISAVMGDKKNDTEAGEEKAPENALEEKVSDEGEKAETQPEVKIFKKGEPLYKAEKMADDVLPAHPETKDNKDKKDKKGKKKKKGEIEAKAMDSAAAVTAENIDTPDGEENVKKSPMREVLDFCLPIIVALVVAMLLKSCVFANAQVPTGSMLNTIQEGDRIIASRLEYKFHDPERYDVVIFKFPDDVAAHEKDKSVKVEYFVKRIIGLPGETVNIVNGVVYVTDKDGNTQQLRDDFVTACVPTGNYGPYIVPEDSYFVLGDNRESSIDSRFWETTNYVKRDLLVGKVKFRYYPSIGKIE